MLAEMITPFIPCWSLWVPIAYVGPYLPWPRSGYPMHMPLTKVQVSSQAQSSRFQELPQEVPNPLCVCVSGQRSQPTTAGGHTADDSKGQHDVIY